MMLAILLDRGSTVKRDPEQAIFCAERAAANPARDTDPIKDLRPIDMQVLLGRLLVKSPTQPRRPAASRLWGSSPPPAVATPRPIWQRRSAVATRCRPARCWSRRHAPIRATRALAPLADILIKGEGGPKDEQRALSLLRGRSAADAQAAQAYLGELMLEGPLGARRRR